MARGLVNHSSADSGVTSWPHQILPFSPAYSCSNGSRHTPHIQGPRDAYFRASPASGSECRHSGPQFQGRTSDSARENPGLADMLFRYLELLPRAARCGWRLGLWVLLKNQPGGGGGNEARRVSRTQGRCNSCVCGKELTAKNTMIGRAMVRVNAAPRHVFARHACALLLMHRQGKTIGGFMVLHNGCITDTIICMRTVSCRDGDEGAAHQVLAG